MSRRMVTVLCLLALLFGMVFVPAIKAEAATTEFRAGYAKVSVNPATQSVSVKGNYYDNATGETVTNGTITFKGIKVVNDEDALYLSSYGTPEKRMGVTTLKAGSYIGEKRITSDIALDGQYQILDGDLYVTCTALLGTNGKLVLLMTLDQSGVAEDVRDRIRAEVMEELAEPLEKLNNELPVTIDLQTTDIIINASHTHSAINITSTRQKNTHWREEIFFPGIRQAAHDALNDFDYVNQIKVGRVTPEGDFADLKYLSTIRHYKYNIYQCPTCGHESYTTGILNNCPASGCYATMKLVEKYYGDSFSTRPQGVKAPTSMQEAAEDTYQDMFLVQFDRASRQDIVLVNWRAHPHITGGDDESVISADLTGAFRETLAAEGYHVCYFQGAAGNINERSNDAINSSTGAVTSKNTYADSFYEAEENYPTNYIAHGKRLAAVAKKGLASSIMQTKSMGDIKTVSTTFTAQGQDLSVQIVQLAQQKYAKKVSGYTDYTGFAASKFNYDTDAILAAITPEHKQELMQEIYDGAVAINAAWTNAINAGKTPQQAHAAARSADPTGVLNGRYQANNIVSVLKSFVDENGKVDYEAFVATPSYKTEELDAIKIGEDLAIVTAPHELFDNISQSIEALDPGKTILTFGYSNGSNGYLPNKEAWYLISSTDGKIYSPYEANVCKYKIGTAERMVDCFDGMLAQLDGGSVKSNHCVCTNSTGVFHSDHVCNFDAWQTLQTNSSGTIYLNGKWQLNKNTSVDKLAVQSGTEAMICLNGYTLTTNNTIEIGEGATLSVCGCNTAGVLNNSSSSATVLNVMSGAKLFIYGGTVTGQRNGSTTRHRTVITEGNVYMFGGTIEGGKTTLMGSGSNVTMTGGNFWLYGGTIQNGVVEKNKNATASDVHGCGGNVYMGGGVFEQHGGTIQNGEAGVSGGNVALIGGEYRLYGGEIADGSITALADGADAPAAKNTWGCGGNVYAGGGHFRQYGGTIRDGIAPVSGGNVYLQRLTSTDPATEYTIHTDSVNAQILDGKAMAGNGGNVCTAAGGMFTMYSGTVSGGEAKYVSLNDGTGNGGNIYSGTTLTITGGTVQDGVAAFCGGNIYAATTLRVGCTVSGGDASWKGNNIYFRSGNYVLNMTDAVIKDPVGQAAENVNVNAAKIVKLVNTQILGGRQAIVINGTDADGCDTTETKKEAHGVWLDGALAFEGTQADIVLDTNSPLCIYDTMDLSPFYYNNGCDMDGNPITEDNRISIMCTEEVADFRFARKAIAYEKDASGAYIKENGEFVLHIPTLQLGQAKFCFVGAGGERIGVETGGITTKPTTEEDIKKQWLYFDDKIAAVEGTDTTYTLQEAVNYASANGGTIELLQDADLQDAILTIPATETPHDVVINLNGYDLIAKTIVNNSGKKLAFVDMSSLNYADKVHGKLYTNSIEEVENQLQHTDSAGKKRRFLRIPEDPNGDGLPGYSFHRVFFNPHSVGMSPSITAITFKTAFLADVQVVDKLEAYGLQIRIYLNGENVGNSAASFVKRGNKFQAGPYDSTDLGAYLDEYSAITGVLDDGAGYTGEEKARMVIEIQPAVKIDGEVIAAGNIVRQSFADMVGVANRSWGTLTQAQKNGVRLMYKRYESILGTWDDSEVGNIRNEITNDEDLSASVDTDPDGLPWE